MKRFLLSSLNAYLAAVVFVGAAIALRLGCAAFAKLATPRGTGILSEEPTALRLTF